MMMVDKAIFEVTRKELFTAVVGDAVAKAAGVPVAEVRRALMLRGDLGA